jgi:hypothetical protein
MDSRPRLTIGWARRVSFRTTAPDSLSLPPPGEDTRLSDATVLERAHNSTLGGVAGSSARRRAGDRRGYRWHRRRTQAAEDDTEGVSGRDGLNALGVRAAASGGEVSPLLEAPTASASLRPSRAAPWPHPPSTSPPRHRRTVAAARGRGQPERRGHLAASLPLANGPQHPRPPSGPAENGRDTAGRPDAELGQPGRCG